MFCGSFKFPHSSGIEGRARAVAPFPEGNGSEENCKAEYPTQRATASAATSNPTIHTFSISFPPFLFPYIQSVYYQNSTCQLVPQQLLLYPAKRQAGQQETGIDPYPLLQHGVPRGMVQHQRAGQCEQRRAPEIGGKILQKQEGQVAQRD